MLGECAQWIGWLEVSRVSVHICACIRAAPLVPRTTHAHDHGQGLRIGFRCPGTSRRWRWPLDARFIRPSCSAVVPWYVM
jgi:hypothetical protein